MIIRSVAGACSMSWTTKARGRFASLEPACRDALFGSPDELGHDVNPVGKKINIEGQVFTVIGMFKHYMSEQERKAREYVATHPSATNLLERFRHGRSGWVFRRKNNTVYIPLNTMWLRFRAAAGTNNTPDPTSDRPGGESFRREPD